MVTHLKAQDLLPADQHDFRQYRSTLTQLLSHWDMVLDSLEQGESVDVIYTDFSKAFDKCETIDTFDTFSTIRSKTSGAAFALAHSPAPGRLLSDQYTHLLKNNIVVFLRRSPTQVLTRLIVA